MRFGELVEMRCSNPRCKKRVSFPSEHHKAIELKCLKCGTVIGTYGKHWQLKLVEKGKEKLQ